MGYARPTARPAARPVDGIFHDHVTLIPPVPSLKIDHWSFFKVGMGIIWRLALIPYFENRSVLDFTYRNRASEGFGGFEADRLRDRILSTQRTWRGRGRDFIYTENFVRPRFGFYLRNEFRAAGVRC